MVFIADPPASPAHRKSRRRWHLAPVITHGAETLEGARVLDEVPGALGVLLWQVLRDVRLWTETPVPVRGDLFSPGAATRLRRMGRQARPDAPLRKALKKLVAFCANGPENDMVEVSRACVQAAQWAIAAGRLATALDFSQAAALGQPSDATAALNVGRLASQLGERARAETWFRRTITVARRGQDWDPYATALLELGRLYLERNNRRAARRFLIRAARAAARRGFSSLRDAAQEELDSLA
jgi:tetratricopeptide (TPR) repeat protein